MKKCSAMQDTAVEKLYRRWKITRSPVIYQTSVNTNHQEKDLPTMQRMIVTLVHREKHLVFKKIHDSHGGTYKMRHYRSSAKDCKGCPLKTVCIGKSNEKKIEDTIDKPLYDRMHQRLQTNYAKRMKKIRQSTVEPVFGTLINYLSLRRVNTRGIKQANKCMLMSAVAYNIKKLLNWQNKKVQTSVQALQKAVSASVFMLSDFLFCHNTKNQLQPAVIF